MFEPEALLFRGKTAQAASRPRWDDPFSVHRDRSHPVLYKVIEEMLEALWWKIQVLQVALNVDKHPKRTLFRFSPNPPIISSVFFFFQLLTYQK